MTLQLDASPRFPALAYDEEATVVADLRLPDEAYGPTSDQPTVLAKANPILDFDLLALPAVTSPCDERPAHAAPSASVAVPVAAPLPKLAAPSERTTTGIVLGIWAATFMVLSVLGYLVAGAHARSTSPSSGADLHVTR